MSNLDAGHAASLGHRILREEWQFLDPPRHLQVFTPRALKRLVVAAGFKVCAYAPRSALLPVMLPLVRARRDTARSSLMRPLARRGTAARVCGKACAAFLDREAGEEIALVAVR